MYCLSVACLIYIYYTICNGYYDEWQNEFSYYSYIDGSDKYGLYWNTYNSTHLEIGLEVESRGWVGFGISDNGQMPNADIVMAWIDDNDGSIYLQNRYTTNQREIPELMEDESNIELIEGFQINRKTYIRFYRYMFPCNEGSKQIVTGTSRIIYAWNDDDPIDNIPIFHGNNNRGSESANLMNGEIPTIEMPSEYETFDLLMTQYSVPNHDTTYYCKLLQLPQLHDMRHVVRIDPVIQEGNEGLVHHTIMYHCPDQFAHPDDVGKETLCNNWRNMAPSSSGCRSGQVLYSWAVGRKAFYFPQHLGLEIGGDNADRVHYILLEIHYNNPKEMSGFIDSSGLRLFYTKQLREHGVGVTMLGLSASPIGQFIPSGLNSVINRGYCLGQCTRAIIPSQGIKMFGSILHGHTTAKAMKLRHIRKNVELEPVNINQAFDFDYQQLTLLKEERDLLPGDTFIAECTYDTTKLNHVIYGGQSTSEEMCINYIYYYPRIPSFTFCGTQHLSFQYSSWLNSARNNGFYDSQTDFYDVNVEGALQHYLNYIESSNYLRYQSCTGGSGTINIGLNFEEYENANNYDCDQQLKKHIDSAIEDESRIQDDSNRNSWYIAIAICCSVCILCIIIMYVFEMKRKKNKNRYININ